MGKIYRITVLFLVLASVLVITACQKTIVTLQVGFVLGKTRARKWGLKAII